METSRHPMGTREVPFVKIARVLSHEDNLSFIPSYPRQRCPWAYVREGLGVKDQASVKTRGIPCTLLGGLFNWLGWKTLQMDGAAWSSGACMYVQQSVLPPNAISQPWRNVQQC